MNGTSILLLFVFLVAGYVIQPLVLPKLQESGYGTTIDSVEIDDDQKPIDENIDSTIEPQPEEISDPVVKPEPRITDEPTTPDIVDVTPEPTPEPIADPEPDPEPTGLKLTDAQLVNAMQSSIQSGEITEFKSAQVSEWRASGSETIAGENYQVGIAAFTAKTLFGDQTHEAKALFQNGKLVKWVWASNNFGMK